MTDEQKPLAPSTIRKYSSQWRHFAAWCEREGLTALPASPETVIRFMDAVKKTMKVSTLERYVIAITQKHLAEGNEPPSAQGRKIMYAMKRIRRECGQPQVSKKALLTEDILRMVDATPETVGGYRDRLLLLLGFSMAARRSELAALDVSDIEEVPRSGVMVTIRRSKTDQEGRGRKVPVPFGKNGDRFCPVHALRDYQQEAGVVSGALFLRLNKHGQVLPGKRLGAQSIAAVVKHYAAAIGLDPAKYAGHSLRSGLATSAAMGGASDRSIMNITGHRSRKMLDKYIQEAEHWKGNAASAAGL